MNGPCAIWFLIFTMKEMASSITSTATAVNGDFIVTVHANLAPKSSLKLELLMEKRSEKLPRYILTLASMFVIFLRFSAG